MSGVQTAAAALQLDSWVAQHPGDRAEQQDRAAVLHSRLAGHCRLALVADGSGRGAAGALAADNVLLTARRSFEDFTPATDPAEHYLSALIDEAHAVLRIDATTSGLAPRSTVAAVLTQPGRIDWCHVGDSRIYHFRRKRLASCTADHNHAQKLVATQGLGAEQALRHPRSRLLTQALGTSQTPRPTFGHLADPEVDDTFLICTDGLWEYFHAGEIALVIREGTLGQAADTLMRRARERAEGRGDNCSLVLLRLLAPPPATRPGHQA